MARYSYLSALERIVVVHVEGERLEPRSGDGALPVTAERIPDEAVGRGD